MTTFDLADRVFANAAAFSVRREVLPAATPIDEIARTALRMLRTLADQEDDRILRGLRQQLGTLRRTVLGALQPLGASPLQLLEQIRRIEASADAFGADLLADASRLGVAGEAAATITESPKERALVSLLQEFRGRVGVVFPARAVPGWDDALVRRLRGRGSAELVPVVSRKALAHADFQALISVWPLKRISFAEELLFAYTAPILHLILYRGEDGRVPEASSLPEVGVTATPIQRPYVVNCESIEAYDEEPDIDQWTQPLGAAVPAAGYDHDRQYVVSARYVRLATGQVVALPEERRVLEVSSLLDSDAADAPSKLPRTLARDLESGDLIVLRTSGSGEYMVDVADQLLSRDGYKDSVDAALAWKQALAKALQENGSAVVSGMLRERCHSFSSPDDYVWNWSTDAVIKPEAVETFFALLDVLDALGATGQVTVEQREHIWEMMKLVDRYHIRAGQQIRRALLARLRELVKAHVVVTSHLNLELPDVDAGQLSVLRVDSVAPNSSLVPYTEINVLRAEEV